MNEALVGAAVGVLTIAFTRIIRGERWLYSVFCFVVDVVVGAYLLWLSQRVPEANLRLAKA